MVGQRYETRSRSGCARILAICLIGVLGVVSSSDAVQAQYRNPCPTNWLNDGDCDEPEGLGNCAEGTDVADCSNPYSNYGAGSGFAGGGYQPPGQRPPTQSGGLYDPCPYTNDGDCDEPNGLGYCAFGTDTADCSNPNSNFGSGSGYRGSLAGRPAPGGSVREMELDNGFFGNLCIPGTRPLSIERGRQAILFRILELTHTSDRNCQSGTASISISARNGTGRIDIDLHQGGAANRFWAQVLPAGDYVVRFTYPVPARLRLQFTIE